jgi:Tfp pilus assembly protein FimV
MRTRRLLLLLTVAAMLLVVVPGIARGGADPPAPTYVYVVQPGDTLWQIAGRLDAGGDRRPLVDELARANGVQGTLQVGQQLRVPAPLDQATPG